jgi:hypothetical protein
MCKNGILQRVFAALQAAEIVAVHVEVLALQHFMQGSPDGHGA